MGIEGLADGLGPERLGVEYEQAEEEQPAPGDQAHDNQVGTSASLGTVSTNSAHTTHTSALIATGSEHAVMTAVPAPKNASVIPTRNTLSVAEPS